MNDKTIQTIKEQMEYQELKLKCNSWKTDSEELRKLRLALIKLIPDEMILERLRSLKRMKNRI